MTLNVHLQHIGICHFVAAGLLLVSSASVRAQTVVSTIQVGKNPVAVAANPVTHQVFVANFSPQYPHSGPCLAAVGIVTVIDGPTQATHTVGLSLLQSPMVVAVNSATDKAYVVSPAVVNTTSGGCNAPAAVTAIDGTNLNVSGLSLGWVLHPRAVAVNGTTGNVYVAETDTGLRRVAVIDGKTGALTTVQVGSDPTALAVNPTTDKIYVANAYSSNVSVIDGATNLVSTVADPNGIAPVAVGVNAITNKTYVANQGSNNVTVIDGATNTTTTLSDPNAGTPQALAVNSTTNKIYVANSGSNNVTVIDGATHAVTSVAVGISPVAVAVNLETDRIYVANSGDSSNPGSVTVIDGETNSTTTLIDPKAVNPNAVAVHPATDLAYVANSGSNNVTVIAGGPNFSLTPASPKLTVQRGSQGTDVMTIAGLNGPFGSSIELTCAITGLAPLPACTLSPSSVTPGTSSAPSTLTITAPAAAVLLIPPDHRQLGRPFYALLLPFVFGATIIGRSKRPRRWYGALCGFLLLLLFLQTACGGNSPVTQRPGPVNYMVTVTAASGAIQHSTQVALTVQ